MSFPESCLSGPNPEQIRTSAFILQPSSELATRAQTPLAARLAKSAALPFPRMFDHAGSDHVVQYGQVVTLPSFEQPHRPASAIPSKLQQKLAFVAAVRHMPHVAGEVMSVSSRHGTYLSTSIPQHECRV